MRKVVLLVSFCTVTSIRRELDEKEKQREGEIEKGYIFTDDDDDDADDDYSRYYIYSLLHREHRFIYRMPIPLVFLR